MGIVQEKFQVTQPQNHNDEERGWVTDKAARVSKGFPGHSNRMPPGQDIEDQAQTDQPSFPMRMSSEGDVTPDYSQKALKTGYTAHSCCPTDDEYANAHTDAFYDSVKVDGVEGFVERNNMLDRL
jgi:hypothetical protein